MSGNRIQHAHRLKLIDFWGIKLGENIFEVGCGQGDTTEALAHTVGEKGSVYGIDIASPDYGGPETLGQARERITRSPLGSRIKMHFNFDLLSNTTGFDPGQFDCAVLSHCLWYMSSYDELTNLLTAAREYCKKLCIAEWDPNITLPTQLPHYNAATIQAICESISPSNSTNIRTMFYPADIQKAVTESGWIIQQSLCIYSEDMQDGTWEAAMVRDIFKDRIDNIQTMPPKLQALLSSQTCELSKATDIKPMSAFCLVAD